MAKLVLGVPNMTFPASGAAVSRALNIDGVDAVEPDWRERKVTVHYDHRQTDQTQIELALSSVGFYPYVIDALGNTEAPK